MKVVDAVKKKLNLPNLQVKNIPVTSQNRIPLVQNGTVDIECGSTTNNLERQQQAAFSDTIFIIGTRLMTKKDSGIKDFADLKGKNVVTTAGTTSERLLRKMNDDKKLGMNIISAKDHGDSFLTLESGRAVAFMMDDALLYGEREGQAAGRLGDRRHAAVGRGLRLHDAQGRCGLQEGRRRGDLASPRSRAKPRRSTRSGSEPDPAEGPEPELPAVRFDEEAVREPERQGARLTTPPLTQK
jgi:hypothetical protein